jgi:carbon monoxide dehydrogenase subunit G
VELVSERIIKAPRDAVWKSLNDPEILKAAIPGCTELVKVSDTEFTAKVKVKIGPVSAKFSGKVELSDIQAPDGYTLTGEGTGGVAGFAKGQAVIKLEPLSADVTRLSYQVKATVGGKIAQLGSRLITSTTNKLAEQFFSNFNRAVGAAPPDGSAVSAAPGTE